ncbi:DEAD/DEAH box helicase [Mycobacterium marinum]|uniref:DEAD/DEAH box helicase n=1 Tax=Mycobacterium marinum TaxID=1781 RepID=UPI00045FEA9B|nr:DEAD/DEAH box helicase [Mycobacterium marinum]CDM77196.1 putative helicase [Mycobacterium marinum E11]
MGDFDTLLRSLDADPQVRGKQFEQVCKWFFENDPVYSRDLRRVWLWKDWPGRWGGDAGIDLVAEDRTGDLWAIQAKAYDPKYRVSKKDVDKFLSESGRKVFAFRMLIATTDLIDRTGERTIQQQEKRSTFFRLNDLRAAAVDWPKSPAQLRPAKRRTPAKPRPHQKEAIRDVVKGFTTSDRGQLIMACGTGKTLTGLFIAEKLEAQRTLVLLPSLSLLKQTLNEWRANCANDFASLPVCSDDTVAGIDDAAIAHTADLGVPVTTDPKEIAEFLRRKSGPLAVFSTYQSSPRIEAAFRLGRVPRFDLVVADEAHRVAGPVSSDFATVLDSTAIRGDRRLFMTATPRYFTGRVLKAAQEADFEVASMDDETKFGPVFHRLSFGEAIERDLLTDYQVAVVGVDDATYREWAEKGTLVTGDGKTIDNAATLAGQIGLAKAMRKYDLHRVISFHSRVKSAREFAASMPEVIGWMPSRQRPKGRFWSDVATGQMPAGDRYVLLQHLGRLDDADRGLLANARCLSEGVDVPTLDGVAFIDPRRSEVDIVQAVGRAIRKSDAKTVGTIVIPVFIDTEVDPEAALYSSAFKPVWDIVKALRAHDDDLGEQLDELRRALGRRAGRITLPPKIHVDIPTRVGADFAAAFDARLIEYTTTTWEFWFGLLQRYTECNGHSRVPQSLVIDGFPLGKWVNKQRAQYILRTLRADREQRLQGLPGWTWEPKAELWDNGFDALLAYVALHGHARVPQSFNSDGYPLGRWVSKQRARHAEGSLDADRESRLEAIPGWTWDPAVDQWEDGFSRLVDYVEIHGHARVPRSCAVDGFKLGQWVVTRRVKHLKDSMDADRARRLNELPGWTWEPFADKWEEGFTHLVKYAERQGNCRIPASCIDNGFKLGQWTTLQRQDYGKGILDVSRQRRLSDVAGWTWDPVADRWEEGFNRLVEYTKHYGDALVPQTYSLNGYQLGAWVNTQRSRYAKGNLEQDRTRRLKALPGWTWGSRVDKWEKGFHQLQAYVEIHGDTRVPRGYATDGFNLGDWVSNQRARRSILDEDRTKRLAALPGWTWDPHADKWEEGFRHLQAYVEIHGDVRVPRPHTVNGYKLGSWVMIQRGSYNNGTLEADRQNRLERLHGWVWDPHGDRWEEGYGRLVEYAKGEGHTKVPQLYTVDGYRLGAWVSQQHYKHTEGTLSAKRKERLERLPGWTWRTSSTSRLADRG